MKKSLLAMMLLAGAATVNAQQTVQVGDLSNPVMVTSTTSFPWYSAYECSSSEMVYTADDLQDVIAGNLTKLEFAVIGGQMTYAHIRVWLENTTDDEVVAVATPGAMRNTDEMTKVYDTAGKGYVFDERTMNAYDGTPTNPGFMDFPFDSKFKYTGGGLRIRFEATGENWCADQFYFMVDETKNEETNKKNCSVIYDFTESGMRGRTAEDSRSFPVIKLTVEEIPTGVNDLEVKDAKSVTYYNAQGQKVDANAKGLVISSDGKKFFRN